MITITNLKLKSFTPVWARFRGFTVLFDNPGASLDDDGEYATLNTDPDIDFYVAVKQSLHNIGGMSLTNAYLLALLPYHSYHVTVWDGINDSNLPNVHAKHHRDAATFIDGLPSSITSSNSFTRFIAASSLLRKQHAITFRFDTLHIWDSSVLVATLKPISECMMAFDTLQSQRATHNHSFATEFGTFAREKYCPHVSLGYFANRESAQFAFARLADWRDTFSHTMSHKTISFTSFSLYGFTDMATFIKPQP